MAAASSGAAISVMPATLAAPRSMWLRPLACNSLRTKETVVDRAETVWKALRVFQGANADFADCPIERSAAAAGCDRTMTFDRGAVGGCGMTLVG